jgi:hypothetical protein
MSFVPPSFKDLAKSVNDLFSKDYPVGSTKLEVNTTASNGMVKSPFAKKRRGDYWGVLSVKFTMFSTRNSLPQEQRMTRLEASVQKPKSSTATSQRA